MGSRLVVGVNDLATVRPDLAAEALQDPTSVSAGSNVKISWRCPAGHCYEASVKNRAKGRGCPFCAGKRVLPGFNDLASVDPELAAESLIDATSVTSMSGKKIPWRCARGHEWTAAVYSRRDGSGCPFCAGRRPFPGETDLLTTHPHLAVGALFDLSTVTAGSDRRGRWLCFEGHEYETQVKNRALGGTGCPVCANLEVRRGINDLATVRPDLASEARFDTTLFPAGSNKVVTWVCDLGHEYRASIVGRASRGRGCPYCASQAVLEGFNDLATLRPDLAEEALFDATAVALKSGRMLEWCCPAGHIYRAKPIRRVRGDGCTVCSSRVIIPGINDLQTIRPDLAAQVVVDAGYDPTTLAVSSSKKILWRCDEGHEWLATPNSRSSSGSGCPSCAEHGYNREKPGWLYLLRHDEWKMLQVGITNDPTRRLKFHSGHAWEPVDVRGPMDGFLAQGWENRILEMLRGRGVALAPSGTRQQPARAKVRRRRSEAWWEDEFTVDSILELMRAVEAAEG